jgi:GNAT superfamily N-acetyltransferase
MGRSIAASSGILSVPIPVGSEVTQQTPQPPIADPSNKTVSEQHAAQLQALEDELGRLIPEYAERFARVVGELINRCGAADIEVSTDRWDKFTVIGVRAGNWMFDLETTAGRISPVARVRFPVMLEPEEAIGLDDVRAVLTALLPDAPRFAESLTAEAAGLGPGELTIAVTGELGARTVEFSLGGVTISRRAEVVVGPVEPGDIETLVDRSGESWLVEGLVDSPGKSWLLEDRYQRHQRGAGVLIIARDHTGPVGYAYLSLEEAEEPEISAGLPEVPIMMNFAVAPKYRGHTIGTQLISKIEDAARSHDHNRIAVAVFPSNPAAARLYARLGYQDWGQGSVQCYDVEVLEDGSLRRVPDEEESNVLVKRLPDLNGSPNSTQELDPHVTSSRDEVVVGPVEPGDVDS